MKIMLISLLLFSSSICLIAIITVVFCEPLDIDYEVLSWSLLASIGFYLWGEKYD